MPYKDTFDFRRIGAGFCGSVWSSGQEDQDNHLVAHVIKREDGGPGRSLLNDFKMHKRLLDARERFIGLLETVNFDWSHPIIEIPECHRFLTPRDSGWWQEHLSKFPPGYIPCNSIISGRIPPVSPKVQDLLINEYCPEGLVAEIKNSEANKDCLIRPYLGRRRVLANKTASKQSRFKAFSLRNFPLHLDQMEDLGLNQTDLELYSTIMAESLAMMHWYAQIDANDVEFVLASSHDSTRISNVLGKHTMWLLDFDCCRRMTLDESGIDQAVTAFFQNDPFYPLPNSSQALWRVFRDRYLDCSFLILHRRNLHHHIKLPKVFVRKIESERPATENER